MKSHNIIYVIAAVILFALYILIPFDLITGIIAQISFDKKIDSESMPYLRIIYHSIILGTILSLMVVSILKNFVSQLVNLSYRAILNIPAYQWITLIFLITVGIRILLILLIQNEQVSDFQEYHDFAKHIAAGDGYIRNGQPTAWFPVGYPMFLSILYRLFGVHATVGQLANIIISLLIVLSTYCIANRLFSSSVARLSSLILAIWPNFSAYTGLLCSDLLFTAFLIAMLAVLICMKQDKSLPFILIGLIFALATLTRTGIALFIIPVMLYLFFNRENNSIHKFSLRLAILIIASLIIFAPWWIRNYQVFDRFIPLSTNGGFNFWLGNVQLAQSNDPGAMDMIWPDTEYDMSSYGYKIVWDKIKQNPLKFIYQIPIKTINLFILDISGWRWLQKGSDPKGFPFLIAIALSQLYYMLMIVCTGIGIFFTGKHFSKYFRMGHYLMAVTLCYWVGIHCIFFGKDRYHLPLVPLIAIYAAYGIISILEINKGIDAKE